MNKQELIESIKKITYSDLEYNSPEGMLFQQKDMILDKIRQLDEPQKVKIPKFVAEYIERTKRAGVPFHVAYRVRGMSDTVWEWKKKNQELFARAWLDGYEVEEPLYYVELPNSANGKSLFLTKNKYGVYDVDDYAYSEAKLTEEEIKNVDERYWQFAVKVEEKR